MKIQASIVLLAALLASPSAFAALGGSPTYPATAPGSQFRSVQRAASDSTSTGPATYSVQQTTLDSGTVVREYLLNGTVFAIAWSGPQMPDLRTLLGTYFAQYTADLGVQHSGAGHRRAQINDTGLVVRSEGHMGAFSGHAYLPQALPPGMTESDLH